MPEPERNSQDGFMIEKIKTRPINKKKLIRRTMMTAAMAVIFGLIACFTFLILEPVISNILYPEEEPNVVILPEDQEEMSPEEMLTDIMQQENQAIQDPGEEEAPPLEEEQIQEVLDRIRLDEGHYAQLYNALREYIYLGDDENEIPAVNSQVVTISGTISNTDWFNNVQESSNQVSGVIIADNGKELLILVDYTPLEDSESLALELAEGVYQISAQLKGLDKATNLAVVAVNLSDLPVEYLEVGGLTVATLGSSNVRSMVGIPVVAVGSPMGNSNSLGYGMVSSVNSGLAKVDTSYSLLQTDIYGSPNASGILFDLQGRVVGIITAKERISGMENMITAYGISELKSRIQKLSNEESIAYMGINGVTVPLEIYQRYGVPQGVYIREVDMDSPAMLAGIQPGDILVQVEGEEITDFGGYVSELMGMRPHDTMELTIKRQSQEEYRELSFHIGLAEVP